MGIAAFVIAASLLSSARAQNSALLRPLIADGGPHWPDKPEEYTAWILMIASAITALTNAVDPAIRKLALLISDLVGRRQHRRRKTKDDHAEAKDQT